LRTGGGGGGLTEALLDFLKKFDELEAFFRGKGCEDFGEVAEIAGEQRIHEGGTFWGKMDQSEAPVFRGRGTLDQGVFFEGVEEASDSGACDSGFFGEGSWGLWGVGMPVKEHEDGEAALTEAGRGEAFGFGIEDEVAGTEEVEESGGGAGVEIWVTGSGLEETLEAWELLEEKERHNCGECLLGAKL
jgi:hypothetical protein